MRIKFHGSYCEHEVFGVCWGGGVTRYVEFTENGGGITFIAPSLVTVTEKEFPFRTVYYNNSILHWALVKEDLYEGVIDADREACERFTEILKAEGLVPTTHEIEVEL